MNFLIVVNLLELASAIVGTFYITKYRVDSITRYFVYFLWLTALVEIVFGWIPWFIYYYESLSYYKNTWLVSNHWIYNTYFVISFIFYTVYFLFYIKSKIVKAFMILFIIAYFLSSVYVYISTEIFFNNVSSFTYVLGSIMISLIILWYSYEILKGDTILKFYKNLSSYVAFGALSFHLLVTPIFIYGKYYSDENPEFVSIRTIILYSANIFLYTCYILGFILCFRKNRFG